MSTATTTDRITKQVRLPHPTARVWRALTDAKEFGSWFGARLEGGTLTPGATFRGPKTRAGYEHLSITITVERVEPERLVAWRWNPRSHEAGDDPGHDETTLVVFELEEVPGGTLLTVVESGFDKIPIARKAKALQDHEAGWTMQLEQIGKHLGTAS